MAKRLDAGKFCWPQARFRRRRGSDAPPGAPDCSRLHLLAFGSDVQIA